MILVVFDVDGTLTNTTAIDYTCWLEAFNICFATSIDSIEWSKYPEFTDLALLHAIHEEHLGQPVSEVGIMLFRKQFILRFNAAMRSNMSDFSAVEGAPAFVNRLRNTPGIDIAIATGGFSDSARLKLDLAGVGTDGLAFAASDRWTTRVEIVMDAIRQVQKVHDKPFEKIIAFGDGVWDLAAANLLGYPLIGIDTSKRGAFEDENVLAVFENYNDADAILEVLKNA